MSTASDAVTEMNTSSKIPMGIVWTILVALLTVIIDNQQTISAFVLSLSPDWLDPIVDKLWAFLLALMMLFVGPSRKAKRADIIGYYKKEGGFMKRGLLFFLTICLFVCSLPFNARAANDTDISAAAATAACDAIVDLIDSGAGTAYLKIYDGSKPANVATAIGAQVILSEHALPNPAFGACSDGVGTAVSVGTDSSANATGSADFFRVFNRNGDAVMDGTVGTSGADLNINSVDIGAGASVAISAWTFTVPLSQ